MCWTGPHLDKSCLSPHHCWLGHPILLSSYFKPKLKASQNTKEEGNHVFMMVSQHDKVTVFLQLPATGEKERGYLCALDLHAQLGPCSPFGLSLASVPMMPRAYRKPSFLFQRWSYFCARWNNCCVYHGRDLEGKGIATHSWARLSGGESFITSINCNRDRWVLVWHQKRQNDIFSSSASVSWGSANASLWLSVMCLQISSDGGCDELPGGWCSPGVVGTVTSSRNREGLDSHNIYMNQYPGIAGTEGTGAMVHVMLCLLLSRTNVFHTPSTALPTVSVHWAGDCVLWIDTAHHPGLALLKPWCQRKREDSVGSPIPLQGTGEVCIWMKAVLLEQPWVLSSCSPAETRLEPPGVTVSKVAVAGTRRLQTAKESLAL